jgi:N6-adenosine-specific RNA methylase IME4
MTPHPFAGVFPLLGAVELQALADDMAAHGQREPIWLFEGQVLDGRNRLAACKLAGVEPKWRVFDGTPDAALRLVWSLNFKRRHLTPSQAGACVVEFEALLAPYTVAAQAVQKTGKGTDGSGGRGKKTLASIDAKVSNKQKTASKTAAKLAKQVGVSAATVERALALKKAAPEKFAEVKAGKKSLAQATREVKKATMKAVAKLPTGKFRVFYADPPWSYGSSGVINESDGYGKAARHYPQMTIAELCALDIHGLTETNAVLFLWVTSPLLDECWPVIKAWGFEYKTSMVWDKQAHNYGSYVSVRHEFLLICTRGSCTPDNPTPMPSSVISVQRSKTHSEKPEAFRAVIDRLYDGGAEQKIELFARRAVPGWSQWGNDMAAT